jgi:hypothetical protein
MALRCAEDNFGVKKVLAPRNIPILYFTGKKKIFSRIFKIRGTFIVITERVYHTLNNQ